MDSKVDHYAVLGLPSGKEGANLTVFDIRSAYKRKAKELHPDKCRDLDAKSKFQDLRASYEILMNKDTRKKFDERLHEEEVRENYSKQEVTYMYHTNYWTGNPFDQVPVGHSYFFRQPYDQPQSWFSTGASYLVNHPIVSVTPDGWFVSFV